MNEEPELSGKLLLLAVVLGLLLAIAWHLL